MSEKLTIIKTLLESILKKFDNINGDNFKLYYLKVTFPSKTTEAERKMFWKEWLEGYGNVCTSYKECTYYQFEKKEKGIETSYDVYGSLGGKNVTEGSSILNPVIKTAVTQLYLREFDPEDMPNSDIFLKRLCETSSKKISGEDFLWYEFILKISQEKGCVIDSKEWQNFKPDNCNFTVSFQPLKTDILEASKRILKFLLDKIETGQEQQSENAGGSNEETHPIWTKPLGKKQWAKVFGVSVSTISRWFDDDKYKNKQISDRKWAILYKDLPAEIVARVTDQS